MCMKVKHIISIFIILNLTWKCYAQEEYSNCKYPKEKIELLNHFSTKYNWDKNYKDSIAIVGKIDSILTLDKSVDEKFHLRFIKSQFSNKIDHKIQINKDLLFNAVYDDFTCKHAHMNILFYLSNLKISHRYNDLVLAIHKLEEKKSLMPSEDINHQIALIYYFLERYDLSLVYYLYLSSKINIDHPRKSASLYNNIGLCYEKLGQKEKARDYFLKAITHWKLGKEHGNGNYKYYNLFLKILENNILELKLAPSHTDSINFSRFKTRNGYCYRECRFVFTKSRAKS